VTAFVWAVCSFIFCCGLCAVVFRRELLAMLLGLELMICAVIVSFVYHAGLFSDAEALAAALLIIAVAAAEAVVGLSLILRLSRGGRQAQSSALQELRG
jgi:NADH-quinone oxidoreductase subunit K